MVVPSPLIKSVSEWEGGMHLQCLGCSIKCWGGGPEDFSTPPSILIHWIPPYNEDNNNIVQQQMLPIQF